MCKISIKEKIIEGVPYDRLVQTLAEDCLSELIRDDSVRPLSWDELTRRPLPEGWSVAEVYSALFSLRRLQGIYLPPTFPGAEHRTFYVTTGEFLRAIIDVAKQSSQHSPLYQRMCQRESFPFVQRVLYREVHTAAALDGIEMSLDKTSQLVSGLRPPKGPLERVIANSGRAIVKADGLVDEPFGTKAFDAIYAELTEGVASWELDEALDGDGPSNTAALNGPELADYANDVSKDSNEPSLVTGLFLRETIQVVRPFPHLNNLMSFLLYRLYAFKHDYPVVANIPTIYTTARWENGDISPEDLRFGVSELDLSPSNPHILIMGRDVGAERLSRFTNVQEMRCELYPNEGDITRYLVVNLGILLYALEEMERELEEGMGALWELARLDTTLNYRQNEIVLRARSEQNFEISIAQHQAEHSVAYATARADLLGLVERGYLRQIRRGKKYVYVGGVRIDSEEERSSE